MSDNEKVKNQNPDVTKGMIIIISLIVGLFYGCRNKAEPEKQEEIPLYDKSIIYTYPTEKENNDLLDEYGIDNVNKINELLPKAAELMAKNKKCDKLNGVFLSSKSSPENIVIYGYCVNGERFNLSEKDINDNLSVLTDKQKIEETLPRLMYICEKKILSKLQFPSTYDSSWRESDNIINYDNVTVKKVFTARNAFNLEIKYRAYCYFNDKQEMTGFKIDKYR